MSLLHQAGSQLEALSEEQSGGAIDACLNTLALVYTSLQAKNPLRRAIARYVEMVEIFTASDWTETKYFWFAVVLRNLFKQVL